jgi:hypothetical protein
MNNNEAIEMVKNMLDERHCCVEIRRGNALGGECHACIVSYCLDLLIES